MNKHKIMLMSQLSCDRALASFFKVKVNEATLCVGNPQFFFSYEHYLQKQHDIIVCNQLAVQACREINHLAMQTNDKLVAKCLLITMRTFINGLGDYQELVRINPGLLLYHSIRRMEEVIAS